MNRYIQQTTRSISVPPQYIEEFERLNKLSVEESKKLLKRKEDGEMDDSDLDEEEQEMHEDFIELNVDFDDQFYDTYIFPNAFKRAFSKTRSSYMEETHFKDVKNLRSLSQKWHPGEDLTDYIQTPLKNNYKNVNRKYSS